MKEEIDRLRRLYSQHVLPGRTRTVRLLGRKCSVQLMKTFLGYELKMGRKRVTCPDLTTARYLKIFAELGLKEVEIPYDPTRTAALLPDLREAYLQLNQRLEEKEGSSQQKQLAQRRLYARLRRALAGCREDRGRGA